MAVPRNVLNAPAVALVAATAKTVINLVAGVNDPISALVELSVSLDANVSCLVELCESTQAGVGTSTDSTAAIKQTGGFLAADSTAPAQVTGRTVYTAEPTVLTRLKAWRFSGPGPFVLQSPLGREIQSLLSGSSKYKGLCLRLTAAANCNVDAYVEWE